jgi:hypothetical protein
MALIINPTSVFTLSPENELELVKAPAILSFHASGSFVGREPPGVDAGNARRAAMNGVGLKLAMSETAVVNDGNLDHCISLLALA